MLCRAVTGAGWIRRRLYTDSDLSVVSFRRVVILTSIDAGALRGDLGDRLVIADLEPIDEANRRTESELDRHYADLQPYLLGALLDTVADVLERLPHVQTPGLPRMADFARVLASLDAADGADSRALGLYSAQAGRIAEDVLEADPVATAILELVPNEGEAWSGTATELLHALQPEKPGRSWPNSPRGLSGRLTRLTPALRSAGIEVLRSREGRQRTRVLTIRRASITTVRTVRGLAPAPSHDGSGGRSVDEATEGPEHQRPPDRSAGSGQRNDADGADGSPRTSLSSSPENAGAGPSGYDEMSDSKEGQDRE